MRIIIFITVKNGCAAYVFVETTINIFQDSLMKAQKNSIYLSIL